MAAAQLTYLDYLKALLALGAQLPKAWPLILALWQNLQALANLLHGEQPAGNVSVLGESAEEQAAEKAVLQLMASAGQVQVMSFDRLKGVFAWFQAHPQLEGLLISFLTGALKGAAG